LDVQRDKSKAKLSKLIQAKPVPLFQPCEERVGKVLGQERGEEGSQKNDSRVGGHYHTLTRRGSKKRGDAGICTGGGHSGVALRQEKGRKKEERVARGGERR